MENRHDFNRVRAIFTDIDGVLLGRNPGNYSDPWKALKDGSIEPMNFVKRHIETGERPYICCAVTGTSRPLVEKYLEYMGIRYGTFEHGNGIVLDDGETMPIYQFDSKYKWVEPVVKQLRQVRRKIESDKHLLAKMLDAHPSQISQEHKDFMVAILSDGVPHERVASVIPVFLDGELDYGNVVIKSSHGAVDLRARIGKYDGAEAVRNHMGLERGEIATIEDNDHEWPRVGGFISCPQMSSAPMLEETKRAELDGRGRVLKGDYSSNVIKQLVELVRG